MSKVIYGIVVFIAAGWMSCIYVIEDENQMSSQDSFAAYAHIDSLRVADSLKRADSLKLADSVLAGSIHKDPTIKKFFSGKEIDTRGVRPEQVIEFAKTLIGVKYKYASTDPKQGFDCSGFITYVFNHFDIIVPRSSIDFTEVGQEVDLQTSKPGDLILFTGTDSTERFVGHMGIIVSNDKGQVSFIHSTSGKAYGVTITALNRYYMGRYMKTVRIFG